MILIGLLLILAALAGGAFLFEGTHAQTHPIDLTVLGVTVSLTPLALAAAGAIAVLLLWFGWAFVRTGAKRSARVRREGKEKARQTQEDQAAKEQQWAAEREASQRSTADGA
jgi:uncharacterized membrane protein